jgi:chemotaxis protein CheX
VSGGNDRGLAGELCFLSPQGESLKPAIATIFFESAHIVFHAEFGETPTTVYGSAKSQPFMENDLVIDIEIAGDLSGRACYGFSSEVIATLGGTIDEGGGFDAYAESLVQELANIITGQTLIKLEQHGYNCEISPPEVLESYRFPLPEELDAGEAVHFSYQGGEASIWTDLQLGDEPANTSAIDDGFDQASIDALFAKMAA